MFTIKDILETNQMITQNNLDVRTITMGISLRDCGHPDIKVTAQKVYDKITRKAEKLVQVGEELEMELGVPIINKRIISSTARANPMTPRLSQARKGS